MKNGYKINGGLLFICTMIALAVTLTSSPSFGIPVADSGGPYIISVDQDLRLDGSMSYVTDADAGNYITKYVWAFEFMAIPFAEGATVVLTYEQLVGGIKDYYNTDVILDSYYPFNLWIKDSDGRTDNELTTVMIRSQSASAPVPEPCTIFLLGTGLLCVAGARGTKRFFIRELKS